MATAFIEGGNKMCACFPFLSRKRFIYQVTGVIDITLPILWSNCSGRVCVLSLDEEIEES